MNRFNGPPSQTPDPRRPPNASSTVRSRRTDPCPSNTYEGMFLLDSTKAAVAWDDTVKHVHDILTKHESEIVASRQWDERRLAYPVEGHKKGTYLLTYFKTDGLQPQGDRRRLPPQRRDPPRADPQGPPQAGRPPGQPGDDLDPQRRLEEGGEEEADDRPRPPPRRPRLIVIGSDRRTPIPSTRPALQALLLSMRRQCVTFPLGDNRLVVAANRSRRVHARGGRDDGRFEQGIPDGLV